ncbi:MAG: DNA recombination/repair protein RecA, partial [Clostridia bacterium]|nr:DNA recombination/repair protein RecA [Clostridia bacterium]
MATKKTQAEKIEKAAVSDKKAALETVMSRSERECGKGSIMRLGENVGMNVSAVSTGSLSLDFALGIGGIPK